MPISLRTKVTRSLTVTGVLLSLMGAEQGCQPADNGAPVTSHGGNAFGACHHSTSTLHPSKGAAITARVDVVCDQPVLNHKLTVYLERRTASASWTVVGSKDFDTAPAVGRTKTGEVRAACEPGIYRTRFAVTLEMVKEDHPESGDATDNRQLVITRDDC